MSYYQDELDGLIDENGEWDCEGYIETNQEVQENKTQNKNDRRIRKTRLNKHSKSHA